MCTLNIFEYEISLSCGNIEIITGSLCLDMATLSIGADLWSFRPGRLEIDSWGSLKCLQIRGQKWNMLITVQQQIKSK
jgi:hypothetical protein